MIPSLSHQTFLYFSPSNFGSCWQKLIFWVSNISHLSPNRNNRHWHHYYRDYKAKGRWAIRYPLRILHPKDHLPPRQQRNPERLVKTDSEQLSCMAHDHQGVNCFSQAETPTPQRKGLRSSALRPKKQEPAKLTGPIAVETWVAEEELELWEIRAFTERFDNHNHSSISWSVRDSSLYQSTNLILSPLPLIQQARKREVTGYRFLQDHQQSEDVWGREGAPGESAEAGQDGCPAGGCSGLC